GFQGIGPAFAKIIARAKDGAPYWTEGRSPKTVAALPAVIGHGVDRLPVEIGSGEIPRGTIGARAQEKCTLGGSDEEQHIAVFHLKVTHAAKNRGAKATLVGRRFVDNGGGLKGFESGLHLRGLLIAVRWFLCEAALNDGPEGRWNV